MSEQETKLLGRGVGEPAEDGKVWIRSFRIESELSKSIRKIAIDWGLRKYTDVVEWLLRSHPAVEKMMGQLPESCTECFAPLTEDKTSCTGCDWTS